MNMTPRNIAILVGAIILGLIIGLSYPLLGLLMIIPVLGYVGYVLLGNRGGSEADEATASQARQFTAPGDKGAIFIMRKGFVAGQQGLNVTIDGTLKSQFRTGRFVRAEVDPGEHVIETHMAAQTKGTAMSHRVSVVAGEAVLLDAKLNMGALQGSVELVETRDAGEARAKLSGLKLVEWQDTAA